MRKILAAVTCAAVVSVVAGCGSSSPSANNTGNTATNTTSAASTPAASGGGGAALTNFCGAKSGFAAPNPGTDLSNLRSTFEHAAAQLDVAVRFAPVAIRADVRIIADAYGKFFHAFQAANYDFTKINQADLSAIADARVRAASQHIEAYVAAHCK